MMDVNSKGAIVISIAIRFELDLSLMFQIGVSTRHNAAKE